MLLVLAGLACDSSDEPEARSESSDELESAVRSELVTKAAFPVNMAFAPDGRLFYNELTTGNIRVITAEGVLEPEPFAHVDIRKGYEWGLIGLALDPEFGANHHIYVYFTAPIERTTRPQVVRLTDEDGKGVDPKVILDLPPSFGGVPSQHVAGNIHFGPDGYLYVSVGDYVHEELAQDLSVPQGKILRIRKEDGTAAPDNPFVNEPGADPRIWAYGLRNSFDFTFHPVTGQMYATENGDANCDELNLIVKGGNYGWPLSKVPVAVGEVPACRNPGAREAIYYFAKRAGMKPVSVLSPAAPTGLAFVAWHQYQYLETSLLVCEYNTGLMRHFLLEGIEQNLVTGGEVLVRNCFLDITLDRNGIAYYSSPTEIRRLLPSDRPLPTRPPGGQQLPGASP